MECRENLVAIECRDSCVSLHACLPNFLRVKRGVIGLSRQLTHCLPYFLTCLPAGRELNCYLVILNAVKDPLSLVNYSPGSGDLSSFVVRGDSVVVVVGLSWLSSYRDCYVVAELSPFSFSTSSHYHVVGLSISES